MQARELLANITLLEVAVLKLEEQSSLLQDEVGQARIEREIAELRYSSAHGVRLRSEGLSLNCASSDSNEVLRDDHSVRLSSTVPSCEGQKSNTASSSTPTETTSLQSCMSLRQEPQFKEQPQKGWKVCLDVTSSLSCQLSSEGDACFTRKISSSNQFHIFSLTSLVVLILLVSCDLLFGSPLIVFLWISELKSGF